MTAATRPRRAHLVPGLRFVAIGTAQVSIQLPTDVSQLYWRSGMPRLEAAWAVDTPRLLKLFATRALT